MLTADHENNSYHRQQTISRINHGNTLGRLIYPGNSAEEGGGSHSSSSTMSCTSTLLLLLSLALNRAVTAVQCFVGTNSARKISVEEPYCSFSITYKNDHCDSRPEVVLTDHGNPISDLSPFGVESLCYHTDNSVTCLCFGHLCNDQFNQKEILAMELLKPSSDPRLRRIIVCYLLNNHAHDVFSAKNFEVTASTQEDVG
ncbi:hypothetical protein Y032_0020g29 [Ancylostoma ceylanicum]|uniref:Uncharacterized protein n=2 Tax=Ancylostoma ceylanicum TaxID=53326 RepID=A0A016V0H6_9BILA|nr:hypothetical protein Y032_0020g29 [Ancylostoma ceylanicum]